MKDPCHPPPVPPAPPAPPLPPPPAVPADTPRLEFEPPVLIGPATATCHDCGHGIERPSTAPPAVCGTIGYGFEANTSSVFPDCNACCDNFYALDDVHFLGFNSRTAVGGFDDGRPLYPDRLPLYFSSTAGRSWKAAGSVDGAMITAMTGPAKLIPGPGPSELHSTGYLTPQLDAATNTTVLRSTNTTIFSVRAVDGNATLSWSVVPRRVVFRGWNLSSSCAPPGHVGRFGMRLVGAGVTKLPDGTWFTTGIACLGGDAQTAVQHVAGGKGPTLHCGEHRRVPFIGRVHFCLSCASVHSSSLPGDTDRAH